MTEENKPEFNFDIKLEPGNATINAAFTPEDKELFFQLQNSRSWKLYSKMLTVYAQGVLNSLLALEDPVKIQKNLGIVAGVYFSINQLGIQVKQFKDQSEKAELKRVAAESTKQPRPFR
jgi:hypothetical protein